jgi:hypothetical protein
MRDDVLSAMDWCRKCKIPIERAVIVAEANFFHPTAEAISALNEGQGPFAPGRCVHSIRVGVLFGRQGQGC